MKYIDAEKLITIIEERKAQQDQWVNRYHDPINQEISQELTEILSITTSLQQEHPEGLYFTPLNRLIQKIPSANWNYTVNNYARKLRDCLIREGYRKDAEVLQDYISYMNGNNVPMATMDEQTEDNEERFESIDNAFRRGREVGFREGVESVKQPAEWSEEDEELREELIKLAEYYSKTEDETEFKPHINWLKSLPERFNLQPKQEWNWNDEDFEKFRGVLSKEAFLDEITSTRVAKKLLGFLKHYSPNPHWKPSEEQMKALNEIINTLAVSKHPHENEYLFNILNGLKQNLKKL